MLSLKTESANILRVSNTEYVKPSIIDNIDGYAYDGMHAIAIEVTPSSSLQWLTRLCRYYEYLGDPIWSPFLMWMIESRQVLFPEKITSERENNSLSEVVNV